MHKCNCLDKAPFIVNGNDGNVYHENCEGFVGNVQEMNLNLPFWNDLLGDRTDKFVINGEHYTLGKEYPEKGNGMDGKHVRIKFKESGKKIDSCDLWHQGTVPEEYRTVLQDNAEFVKLLKVKKLHKCNNDKCKFFNETPALINIMNGARGACHFCYKKTNQHQLKVRIA